MTTYNCKFQVYKTNKLFSRQMCEGCTADPINNPKCPSYEAIEVKDFEKIGRTFVAVQKVEEKPVWRITNQIKKLEKMLYGRKKD